MTSLTEFFSRQEDDNLKGISHKNNLFKRNIIAHMAVNGECTLSELTKELHISVPTITKLVQELVQENIVTDLGKVETPGGRRPNIFGLASSAIYFAGVNIGRDNMSFLITDLHNNIVKEEILNDFELQDRPQCLEKICSNIAHFIDTWRRRNARKSSERASASADASIPRRDAVTAISRRANSPCAT